VPIKIDDYLNIGTIEQVLLQSYSRSLQSNALTIDLSDSKWISPFALSVLHCWFSEIHDNKGTVFIIPPKGDTFATRFVNSSGAFRHWQQKGWLRESSDPKAYQFRSTKLAAFETFSSKEAFETYIEKMHGESQRNLLLNANELPEFVKSGNFHKIVLQELIDNTFAHGEGLNR